MRVRNAGGMSNEAIAKAVGISKPTLRKHFLSDLELRADLGCYDHERFNGLFGIVARISQK